MKWSCLRQVGLLSLVSGFVLVSADLAYGQPRDHSGHKSPPGHTACAECDIFSKHDRTERPFEFGQDVLSAMQEMVMLLEGKTDTDWANFDLDRLYTHLVDMNEVTLNANLQATSLADGLEMSLTGSERTLQALRRAIPDHAVTLGKINGWDAAVVVEPARVALTVTSVSPEEVKHIKALGYIGLMAAGTGHHQPFHLALARGETQGGWPREDFITTTTAPANSSMRMAGGEYQHMQMAEGEKEHMQMAEGDKQPYAGLQQRAIKSLSAERMDGLMSGKGIGYALAAELNHYPGPRHVLDMAGELDLSDDQRNKAQYLFDEMQAEAISIGTAIVDKERALDAAFATRTIDRITLEMLVKDKAQLEGRLQLAHLSTHLDMQSLLSPHQVMLYDRLQGYSGETMPGGAAQPMQHRVH